MTPPRIAVPTGTSSLDVPGDADRALSTHTHRLLLAHVVTRGVHTVDMAAVVYAADLAAAGLVVAVHTTVVSAYRAEVSVVRMTPTAAGVVASGVVASGVAAPGVAAPRRYRTVTVVVRVDADDLADTLEDALAGHADVQWFASEDGVTAAARLAAAGVHGRGAA